jgi:hypothetical protein
MSENYDPATMSPQDDEDSEALRLYGAALKVTPPPAPEPLVSAEMALEIDWAAQFFERACAGPVIRHRDDLRLAMGFGEPLHLVAPTPDMQARNDAAAAWLCERDKQTRKIDRTYALMLDTDGRIAANAFRKDALERLLAVPAPAPAAAPEGFDRANEIVTGAVETVWTHMMTMIRSGQAWRDVLTAFRSRENQHHNLTRNNANLNRPAPILDDVLLGYPLDTENVVGYLSDVWRVFPVR